MRTHTYAHAHTWLCWLPQRRGIREQGLPTPHILSCPNSVSPRWRDKRYQHNPNPIHQTKLRRLQPSQPPNREEGWDCARSLQQGCLVPGDPKYPSSSLEKFNAHTYTKLASSGDRGLIQDKQLPPCTGLFPPIWVSFPLARLQDLPRTESAELRVQLPHHLQVSSGSSRTLPDPEGPLPPDYEALVRDNSRGYGQGHTVNCWTSSGKIHSFSAFPSKPSPASLGWLLKSHLNYLSF